MGWGEAAADWGGHREVDYVIELRGFDVGDWGIAAKLNGRSFESCCLFGMGEVQG